MQILQTRNWQRNEFSQFFFLENSSHTNTIDEHIVNTVEIKITDLQFVSNHPLVKFLYWVNEVFVIITRVSKARNIYMYLVMNISRCVYVFSATIKSKLSLSNDWYQSIANCVVRFNGASPFLFFFLSRSLSKIIIWTYVRMHISFVTLTHHYWGEELRGPLMNVKTK